jgi:hypothetical protein
VGRCLRLRDKAKPRQVSLRCYIPHVLQHNAFRMRNSVKIFSPQKKEKMKEEED